MPVVEISALPQGDGIDITAALTSVTRAVADLLGEEPPGTWATWQTLDPGTYVEGDDVATTQPRATHPPLVRVTAFEGRSPEQVARIVEVVAETLVNALALAPGNVFVRYDEAMSRRLYTGGSVVGRKSPRPQ